MTTLMADDLSIRRQHDCLWVAIPACGIADAVVVTCGRACDSGRRWIEPSVRVNVNAQQRLTDAEQLASALSRGVRIARQIAADPDGWEVEHDDVSI